MDAPHPTEPAFVKPLRTYGKRKDVADATNESHPTSHLMRPKIVPSGATEIGSDYSTAGDSFGWKEKMAAFDRYFDEDATAHIVEPLLKRANPKVIPTGSVSAGGEHDYLISTPSDHVAATSTEQITTPATIIKRGNTFRSAVSDESGDDQPSVDHSSPTSPLFSHYINTPKSRSSPTPPTSEAGSEPRRSSKDPKCAALLTDTEMDEAQEIPVKAPNTKKAKQKPKAKGLTKKEKQETELETIRIRVDQTVSIPRRTQQILPLTQLFEKIGKRVASTKPPTSSDPIQEFTSPSSSAVQVACAVSPKPIKKPLPSCLPSDDENLPDSTALIRKDARRKDKDQELLRRKNLAMQKQRALDAAANVHRVDSNSDDDLEVVEAEPSLKVEVKKSPKTLQKLLALAGGPSVSRDTTRSKKDRDSFELAAKPFAQRKSRGSAAGLDQKYVTATVFERAMKHVKDVTKQKEEDWVNRGGKLRGRGTPAHAGEGETVVTLGDVIGRLTANAKEAEFNGDKDGEDGDGEDEDWTPEDRASASPVPVTGPSAQDSDADEDMDGDDSAQADNENDSDDENVLKRPRARPLRQKKQIIDSDAENGSNDEAVLPRILVPNTSFVVDEPLAMQPQAVAHGGSPSSLDATSPDEDNKENDTRRMFDEGEDKENTAVPRHVPFGRAGIRAESAASRDGGLFGLADNVQRRLSMSPFPEAQAVDDPFAFSPPGRAVGPRKLEKLPGGRLSITRSGLSSPQLLQPAFGASAGQGFSQFFNDDDGFVPTDTENDENAPPAQGLKPAFNGFQDSPGPAPMKLGSMSGLFTADESNLGNRIKRPGNAEELSLTLDTKLQPALEVTTQLRRRADAIFEKEQIFVLEDANKRSQPKPELYITENGLLTQTRPDVSTPLVYRPVSTQGSTVFSPGSTQTTSTTQRRPLGTISFTSEDSTQLPTPSERQPLSRLVKGRRPLSQMESDDEAASADLRASPTPQPANAFNHLLLAARKEHRKEKAKLGKSEFVEGEAQESDDDEYYGFGKKQVKDDEEEGDDEDGDDVLAELVDDAEMDAETLAQDKVLEKVKEHQALDDVQVEKLHQAAVDGKLRVKRRNGIDMDDSGSDDDDDDEARRLRNKIHKKRKVDGDTLEALAKDQRTLPFFQGYHNDLDEDDYEFIESLGKDDMMEISRDDDDDDETGPRHVSASALREQLREVARSEHVHKPFDPADTTWAEGNSSDIDEDCNVKEVEHRLKKSAALRREGELDGVLGGTERSSTQCTQYTGKLGVWAKEQPARHQATGRSVAAVTGHAQSSKGGRMTKQNASEGKDHAKPVAKAQSMLANLKNRQSAFGL